ncbi:unnamed protein product [Closterium sp. NIES-53]
MAEREMRTVVETVRTMLLHMGVKHHWWHLALRQVVWFMVPEQQRGGKLAPKARWGLHLGVSPESKGWEVLDLTDNKVVMTVEAIFYETMSLEAWKAEHGPILTRKPAVAPMDPSSTTTPLLAVKDDDVEDVTPPSAPTSTSPLPLVADMPKMASPSANGDEGSIAASPSALARGITGVRRDEMHLGGRVQNPSRTGERQAEKLAEEESAEAKLAKEPTIREKSAEESAEAKLAEEPTTEDQLDDDASKQRRRSPWRQGRGAVGRGAVRRHTLLDDANADVDLPELDPDMHADPEHRWDIATMTVKDALASWKGKAVNAAMDEGIKSFIANGTWEMVEHPRNVNIMKNRWLLITKYHVYGEDYDKTYAPVGSYMTLQIFLSIVAVLDLHLMQLDMKNAFLQSKLDHVLYMYQPDYYNDGTGRVCKLLKSLYELKQSPLLWYKALDDVLTSVDWKKIQVDVALYFKVGDDRLTCWVLIYVDDLLAASSSLAMLKELKELLEDTFELCEIKLMRWRFIDEEQTGRVSRMPASVDAYAELRFDDEDAQSCEEEEYRQKFGSLQFAATTMRLDIAFVCSMLGRSQTVRSDNHWHEVDRCLHYLADTRDAALEFGGGPESLRLVGYADADDANDKQNRTSMGGYVFLLDAGKPTILHVDNQSAITVSKGLGLKGNLKHMERRYVWLQHMVKRGKIALQYIPTTEQPADFLTKALHLPAFNRCFVAISHVRLADVGDGDDEVQQ